MKKINAFLGHNLVLIIMLFLMLTPLLDAVKYLSLSYLNVDFTLGAIVKAIFLLFALYYILFINKNRKAVLIYLGLLLIYGLMILIPYPNSTLLYWEMKAFIKVYFFAIMLMFFYLNKEKVKELDHSCFDYIFFIYMFLIVMLYFLRGFLNYSLDMKEIGAVVALLFPLYVNKMLNSEDKVSYLPLIILYICTMFIVGTKAPIISFVITILILGLKYFIMLIKKKEVKKIIALVILKIALIIFIIAILPETPFYSNLEKQMNYFDIHSYKEIFTSYDNINNIIFSKRLTLAENSINNFKLASNYHKLVGTGYYELNNNEVIKKTSSEVDYVDLLTSYGIIGLLLFFIPVIYILTNLLINLKTNRELKITLCLLVFVLALFTGNVFIAPAVSLYAAILLSW